MNTAVLIHGCHLQAEGLESVIWGDPRNGVFGRVPKGIIEAFKFNAHTIIFPTGSSSKDGTLEGKYIYWYACTHLDELINSNPALPFVSPLELEIWLGERAVLELTSQDTRSELVACARVAKERGAQRLVIVSSPTHIIRCLKEAISVLGADPELRFFLDNLYATASDTCFVGSTVDDVLTLEPPHRADRPMVPIYKNAHRLVQFLGKEALAVEFNEAFSAFLDAWEAKALEDTPDR